MKPELKKLAEQAGIDFQSGIGDDNEPKEYAEAWLDQLEAFAKLVAMDCAQICNERGKFWGENIPQGAESERDWQANEALSCGADIAAKYS